MSDIPYCTTLPSSWDCFDTLVFRRLKTPESVFQLMETELNLPGFTHQRKEAEKRAPSTIADAYRELALFYGWSDNERQNALDLEVATEVEECFPVVENISKVKQGDIVVSDMYLAEEHIRKILYKCGVTHNIPIYVSSDGKHNGWIWSKLPALAQHTGDNHHSDAVSAERNGIKANHYTDTLDFTANEKLVGGDLALLMRMLRLSNPYVREDIRYMLWNEQAQLNIPALVLIALELPKSNLAFVHRDCVHLQPIHEALYGVKNNEFHCSRLALNHTNVEYMEYVRNTTYGRTIVDLQGSGKSLYNYWSKCFGEYPELLYVSGPITKERRLLDVVSDILEKYNSSMLGSLSDWPLRKCNEFNPAYLEAQQMTVMKAVQMLTKFSFARNKESLYSLIRLMESGETPKIMKHMENH